MAAEGGLVLPCLRAYDSRWLEGMAGCGERKESRGGRRKGRTPVGEAWLLEERVRNSRPASLRNVCGTKKGVSQIMMARPGQWLAHWWGGFCDGVDGPAT